MAKDKKVYLGGLFDFQSAACEEITGLFNNTFPDTFVSYDRSIKSFSFMVPKNNDTAVSVFAAHLKAYVEEQQQLDGDPYQSPKMRPFEGTVPQNPLIDDLRLDDADALLNISDDDASSDEGTSEGHGLAGTLWKPEQGKITIMTPDLVKVLAQMTGCSFFATNGSNAVGISGANSDRALRKLLNLEGLQHLLADRRSGESFKATSNILMLRKMGDSVIQFVPLTDSRPYQRVIVNEQAQFHLHRKYVEELRQVLLTGRNQLGVPENLHNSAGTAENRSSSIWGDFSSIALGNRKNMEPRRRSTIRADSSAEAMAASQVAPKPTSLLPAAETRSIETWAKNITAVANPNEIATEPPKPDEEPRVGRQRRVLVDSDDEDEPVRAPPRTTTEVDPSIEEQHASPFNLAAASDKEELVRLGNPDVDQEPALPVQIPASSSEQRETAASSVDEGRPLQTANVPTRIGRRRRLVAIDSDASDEDRKPQAAATPANANPYTPSQIAVGPEGPSMPTQRSQAPASTAPSIPASFNVNAYRGSANASPRRGQASGAQTDSRGNGNEAATRGRGGQTQVSSQVDPGSGGTAPRGSRGVNQARGARGRGSNVSMRPAPQPATRGQSTGRGQSQSRGYGRGRRHGTDNSRPSYEENPLIELAPTNDASPAMPPPGLHMRFGSPEQEPKTHDLANIVDEPVPEIQRPSLPPATLSTSTKHAGSSVPPARTSHTTSSGSVSFHINRHNPGADVAAMERQRISEVREMQKQDKAQKAARAQREAATTAHKRCGTGPQPSVTAPRQTRTPSEGIQEEDEVTSRRFHHTMGQGAPNPSQKGKGQKPQETKKEREARTAKAKAEAHGEIAVAMKPSIKIGSSSDEVDKEMSTKKRQILKQVEAMADTNPITVKDDLKTVQTERLIETLSPLFEAGRAFSGKLRFELQFGQVLLPSVGSTQYITIKEWHEKFQPLDGKFPMIATFTNILTTNGADVDRILDMRSQSLGVSRVWSKTNPGPTSVTYEFLCQSKDSEDFLLVVNQNGTYEIQSPSTSIGMVKLHYPGQVWDACAVLSGNLNHSFSDKLVAAANTFVSSLYIPPNLKNISITYRLPETNEMTIKNLVMKRTSLHACNMLDKQDFQLQITEVQTLYHQFHKNDKKLGQGFAKEFPLMVNDGQLHYEISLVHKGVSGLLEKNEELELGELTAKWTRKQLLEPQSMRTIVDLTSLVVSKIDGIGSKNIGSLYRMDMEQMADERTARIDPVASTRPATSRLDPGAANHIRGVRGGKAHVVWHDGKAYAYGLGGALVPLEEVRGGSGSDEVVPDDSASQAPLRALLPSPPVRNVPPAQSAAIMTSVQPRAGPGFW